jgi:signal transduction histidine kinase
METKQAESLTPEEKERVEQLFQQQKDANNRKTDTMFTYLLAAQWIVAIFVASVISPYSWEGKEKVFHLHFYLAVFMGGGITLFPILLAKLRPGWVVTRHVIAISQMLFSALFIHLSGGRIETHFHVFGSLAFLAFYLDWPVLLNATLVVVVDHFFRGLLYPESVYGIVNPEWWRFLEHAGWVAFEDIILVWSCVSGVNTMRETALSHMKLEAIDRMKEVNEMKNDLIAVVSHQLKTPVGEINGYIENLLEGVAGPLNSKQMEYLKDMREISVENFRLISDLLSVSKIERGVLSVDLKPVSLNDLVEMAIRDYEQPLRQKGLTLVVEKAQKDFVVYADREKTVETLRNLVNNAVKCTDQGSITISVKQEGEKGLVEVCDTGIGMSPETMGRLFAKTRVLGKESIRSGAGLGLFIAKSFMNLQNGDITVSSQLGKGSCFSLSIPGFKGLEGAAA